MTQNPAWKAFKEQGPTEKSGNNASLCEGSGGGDDDAPRSHNTQSPSADLVNRKTVKWGVGRDQLQGKASCFRAVFLSLRLDVCAMRF